MRPSLTLFVSLLFSGFLAAQTNLSGVINQAASVLSIDTCYARLTVDEAGAFLPDQTVLVIQMKGAIIDETNSAAFGSMLDLGQAGLFEKNVIDSIDGNSIFLKNKLLHPYLPAGTVQLVSFPTYTSAVIADTLFAPAWNGATGGILALEVTDTLFLQAPLSASGKGFRGGQLNVLPSSCQWFLNENNYFYDLSNWRGAPKGEGIAALIPGKEQGRGPQANGGGGGNDHNSGGGGGGNRALGGPGGEQSPPSLFSCFGEFPGLGGKSLPTDTSRLFLGGGGGAGHADNPGSGSPGGTGGGIIFVQAGVVVANNQWILAQGSDASLAPGDGGGGGGGGGSVVLLASEVLGDLNLSLQGGKGADNLNTPDRCYGPGGGGSGGALLTNMPTLPNVNLQGGAAGENLVASSACNSASNGAQAGNAGISTLLLGIPSSDIPFAPTAIVQQPPAQLPGCAGSALLISLEAEGASLAFQWQVDTGNGFQDLTETGPYSGTQSAFLSIDPVSLALQGLQYRCLVNSACFAPLASSPTTLLVEDAPTSAFSWTIGSDLTVSFENLSTGATALVWDFGDNNFSQEVNPTHTYGEEGTYVVSLEVTNACGTALFSDTLPLFQAPESNFSWDLAGGCAPHTVQFSDLSSGNANAWQWSFPGGTPPASDIPNPVVTYTDAGQYDVALIVSNGFAADTLSLAELIEVLAPPVTEIQYTVSNDTFFFTHLTSGGPNLTYQWDFGDGSPPFFGENPTHVFQGPGPFEVTLIVSNLYCGAVDKVIVSLTGDLQMTAGGNWRVYPNPTTGDLWLELPDSVSPWRASLCSSDGRWLKRWEWTSHQPPPLLSLDVLPGCYWLVVQNDEVLLRTPVIVVR